MRKRPNHPLSIAGNPGIEHFLSPKRRDNQFRGCGRTVPGSSGCVHIHRVRSGYDSTATRGGWLNGVHSEDYGYLAADPESGASFSVALVFSPTNTTQNNAQLSLPYVETVPPGAPNGGTLSLSLQGTSPSFVLSYVFPTNQNVVPLQPGGSIAFPPTSVGATGQAALTLTNTGSGAGSVTGISSSGSAFLLQGLPLFPATVNSNVALTVQVLFQPSSVGAYTGQVTIAFASGAPVTINLTGSGTAPSFTYQLLGTNPPATVSPGGAITLPSVNLGQTSSVTLQVLNSGNASGTVSTINAAGQGFAVGNVVLPQTLAPAASLTFTLSFTPTQPATLTGTLTINSTSFTLSGVGLGPLLTFSYIAGGTTIILGGTNNTVVFSPVEISQSSQVSLDVKNTGTLPTTISNIGVQQTGGPFSLSGEPPLPVTLAPNADFHVAIAFTPTTLGYSNTNLLFDTTTVALQGSGTPPPPLPSYTIAGPSGSVAPMTQPNIGLTLASPYPVAISGTLTISTTGTLLTDPALQFATGGTTVSFTIPANQTSAMFGGGATQLGMQTGTVAGTFTITPSFSTQAGAVNITPATPEVLQFTVASAAPALIAIQLTAESTTAAAAGQSTSTSGFTIQVTGFSTTRLLTSLAVQFGIAPGFSMPTSQYTINVSPISTIWFESTASNAFGGQFTISVPFTFQGVVPAGQTVLSAISSVSATASNAVGSSNTVQVALQ